MACIVLVSRWIHPRRPRPKMSCLELQLEMLDRVHALLQMKNCTYYRHVWHVGVPRWSRTSKVSFSFCHDFMSILNWSRCHWSWELAKATVTFCKPRVGSWAYCALDFFVGFDTMYIYFLITHHSSRDWLRRVSPKWPILCWVGCKTLTQSITFCKMEVRGHNIGASSFL